MGYKGSGYSAILALAENIVHVVWHITTKTEYVAVGFIL